MKKLWLRTSLPIMPLLLSLGLILNPQIALAASSPTPTLSSPATNTTYGLIDVNFTLPVAPESGSIDLIFSGTSSDTLALTSKGAGTYSFTINPANVLQNNSSNISSDTSSTISNGTYTVSLSYQDISSDPPATVTATNVVVNTTSIPTLTSTTPANAQNNVAVNSDLTLTFSKAVYAGSGNIVIHKAADGSVVDTIAASSAQVTTNNNVATVVPPASLSYSTPYYVTVDATAFQDGLSNFYAGISNSSSLTFTTAAAPVTPPATATTTTITPDTGYGAPAKHSNAAIIGLMAVALISIAAGLSLIYRRRSNTTGR